MSRPGVLEGAVNCSDNDVANTHSNSANNQECLTAKVIQEQDRGEGEDDLEASSHTGGKEIRGDGCEAKGLEDLGSVIQNGINTLRVG